VSQARRIVQFERRQPHPAPCSPTHISFQMSLTKQSSQVAGTDNGVKHVQCLSGQVLCYDLWRSQILSHAAILAAESTAGTTCFGIRNCSIFCVGFRNLFLFRMILGTNSDHYSVYYQILRVIKKKKG